MYKCGVFCVYIIPHSLVKQISTPLNPLKPKEVTDGNRWKLGVAGLGSGWVFHIGIVSITMHVAAKFEDMKWAFCRVFS